MNILQKFIAPWKQKTSTTYGPGSVGVDLSTYNHVGNQRTNIYGAYENNAIAHACIKRIASDVAGVPLIFLRDPDDDTSYVPDTDPIQQLFDRPNQVMTQRRLIEWTAMLHRLRGEVFWRMETTGRFPTAIYPWYDPRYWEEQVSRAQGLVGWEYRRASTHFTVPPRDVIWFGTANPANPYRGLSPLKPAAGALGIDNTAETLQNDTLSRGGERGMVIKTDLMLDDEQAEQWRARLAARRPGPGRATRDMVIDGGAELQDPKFTREDLDLLAMQGMSKMKICHVYGMAPILIGDDDSAQYASAPHAIKMYWRQTLIPLLRSLEDAWDKYFVHERQLGTYVRFDLSAVESLREDDKILAETARVHHSMGVSLADINDRLGLGYSPEAMVAADAARAEREERQSQLFLSSEPPAYKKAGLTNQVIKSRHHDVIAKTQRDRMLSTTEIRAFRAVKKIGEDYGKRLAKEIESIGVLDENTGRAAAAKIREAEGDLRDDLVAAIGPLHRRAAEIGVVSIQDLVTGKAHEPWHDRVKAVSFSPIIEDEFIARRRLLLQGAVHWSEAMATWVLGEARRAAEEGQAIDTLARAVRDRYANDGTSRGKTIARTEVGTLYNVSRFAEMGSQGFEHHEWLTSIDEVTRETHLDNDGKVRRIGEPFPSGLSYPQESGAPAEEVINCRCETIPAVRD